jgi:hypothetical protein
LIEEQRERKRRAEEELRKRREMLLAEEEGMQQLKEGQLVEKEERRQAKIKAQHDKLEQRREERLRLKESGAEELMKVKASKPLYVQLEENYKQQVLMPELEKHKADLASKRVHFNSVTRQELSEHAKRYEEMKKEQLERRSLQATQSTLDHMTNLANKNSSKFTYGVIEEER